MQHPGGWPSTRDLCMVSAMLSHGPTMNGTHPHMISTRRWATLITYVTSSITCEHLTSHTERGSMVCCYLYSIFSINFLVPGARRLVSEHEELPPNHRYLRCVEQHELPGDGEFRLVICMTAQMSSLLVDAKRISIDTSFKRVRGWQEFEIEGWDNSHQRCKFHPFPFIILTVNLTQ